MESHAMKTTLWTRLMIQTSDTLICLVEINYVLTKLLQLIGRQ